MTLLLLSSCERTAHLRQMSENAARPPPRTPPQSKYRGDVIENLISTTVRAGIINRAVVSTQI